MVVKKLFFVISIVCMTLLQADKTMKQEPNIVKLSWDDITSCVSTICQKLDPTTIDVLVGISVGGLVPTSLFSNELQNKNVTTLSARSYTERQQKELKIGYLPEKSGLEGKRILLIDDIIDTGKTIQKTKELLYNTYHVQSITVVSLYVNSNHCKTYPNLYGHETTDWIEFPWEVVTP